MEYIVKTYFLIALIGLIISCAQTQKKTTSYISNSTNQNIEIINTHSVGEIKLGMNINEFLELTFDNKVVKKELMSLEGENFDIYNIYENDKIVYAAEPYNGKIFRVWVYGEKIMTEKGIGVGSTLGDIREQYENIQFGIG